jgi:small subunit ribosomal protein S20
VVTAPPVANHASALKRHRQTVKRTKRNHALRTELKHYVRAVRQAVAGNDSAAAEAGLRRATRALDKAVTKGLIHRNNAARRVSRLSRAVSQLTAAAQ